MMTRRTFSLWSGALLLACCLGLRPPAHAAGDEFTVMAATFPVWLFTREVCENVPGVRVELFVPAQTGCPHEFTPSPADLNRLARARAVVINGLGLEAFLAQPLRALDLEQAVIDASRGTTPRPAPEDDDGHGHDHGHSHGAPGVNPHIFAGPGQAARMIMAIAEGLSRRDPAHAEAYAANARAASARMEALAGELAAIGRAAPRKGIVIQHDDLAYVAHEAGLDTLAVLHAGDDAAALSAARLHALAKRLAAEKPVLIAGEPPAPDRAMELLAAESGIPFAILDPVASGPADAPADYYERVMAANIEILRRYFDAP